MSTPLKLVKGLNLAPLKKLGSVLTEMGLITEAALEAAAIRGVSKRLRLGELLISEGLVTDVNLAKALAAQYGLEYINLSAITINRYASNLIPEKTARSLLVLPIDHTDGIITLATYDPIQLIKSENITERLGSNIVVKVCTQKQIEETFDKVYTHGNEHSVDKIVKHLSQKHSADHPVKNTPPPIHHSDFKKEINDPSIETLVNKFIERAIQDHASDIHIDPSESIVRVRIRIDGILHELFTFPVNLHSSVTSRIKVLAQLDISEKRQPQDGSFHHPHGAIDIRVATLPTVYGEKIVLRLLDKNKMKGSLSDIGMSSELEASIRKLLVRPFGIVFITGPTGSGKTTTLYSMLHQINGVERNVITVEDPVEYKFDIINQVQVNEKAGLTFSGLLRNVLRQDPDVIMIGEVRDQETAEMAIRAALTGHLVLSTLHTNDAVSAHTRLIDMGIEPFLISSALVAVLAQRLVRVLCTHCRQQISVTEENTRYLGPSSLKTGDKIYAPVGCDQCLHTGYKGRIALFEFLPVDHALQRAIIDRSTEAEITQIIVKNGFKTMRQDGIKRVIEGMTSIDEVLKATL